MYSTRNYANFFPGSQTPAGIAASTTVYVSTALINANATEANVVWYAKYGMKASNMVITTTSAQPASGALTYTFRVGGVDTVLTIVIAANSAAGTYSDNTNEVHIPAEGEMAVKAVNSATATSALIQGGGFYFSTFSGKHSRIKMVIPAVGFGTGIPTSATRYSNLTQFLSTNATEANAQNTLCKSGTFKNFTIRTNNAQPASGPVTWTFKKNLGNTSITITIAAGSAAGLFSDNTNSAECKITDSVGYAGVNSATATSAVYLGYAINFYAQ